MTFLVAVLSFTATLASAQKPAPDVCGTFPKADVIAVLGSDAADQTLLPGTCSWNGKGANLLISRTTLRESAEAGMILDARKAGAGKDEQVQDETGVGQRAVSMVAANKRTLTLMAVDGGVLWTFTLSKGDQAVDVASALPLLKDLARRGLTAR